MGPSGVPDSDSSPASAARAPRSSGLTVRALAAGSGLGAVLAAGNVYVCLKTGYVDGGSIPAAIAGFALLGLGRRKTPYSADENNVTQAVAASAAITTVALGLSGSVPALVLLGAEIPAWALIASGLLCSLLGVQIACALRPRLIEQECLPFPTGLATGEVIRAMHEVAGAGRRRAQVLGASAAAAGVATWLRDGWPAWIPTFTPLPWLGSAEGLAAAGVSWSPLLFSTGLLIGLRGAASILLGSVVGWILLAPRLLPVGARPSYEQLSGLLLWPGLAMTFGAMLVGLVRDGRGVGRAMRDLDGALFATGRWRPLALVVVLLFGLGLHALSLSLAQATLAIVIALVAALVCARAVGETDQGPLGALGQLGQLALGRLGAATPGQTVAGAGLAANTGAHLAQMLWAFRAGRAVGTPHSALVRAQLLGIGVGVLVAWPVYTLITQQSQPGSGAFPAPSARLWAAMASVAREGSAAVSSETLVASAVALGLAMALALLEAVPRLGRRVPSAVGIGMGLLLPPSYGVSMFLGATLLVALRRKPANWREMHVTAAGAGGIAGEAVLGVVIAALMAAGWMGRR